MTFYINDITHHRMMSTDRELKRIEAHALVVKSQLGKLKRTYVLNETTWEKKRQWTWIGLALTGAMSVLVVLMSLAGLNSISFTLGIMLCGILWRQVDQLRHLKGSFQAHIKSYHKTSETLRQEREQLRMAHKRIAQIQGQLSLKHSSEQKGQLTVEQGSSSDDTSIPQDTL